MYEKLVADVEFLNGNYETAAEMYHGGAREGDALAAFNYGYCLWNGIGVKRDAEEAKSFFMFARNLEGGESCYNLAMLYMHGDGVYKDYAKAIHYMEASASMGCVEAQLYMGMACTLGAVFEPDVVGISMIPYHKAQYRDYSVSVLEGYVPDEREEDMRFAVISADARRAFEYFRAAARHDTTYVSELVAKGRFLYAKCYIDGLGTDFDRQKGIRLMLSAGKSGSADAVAFLKENGVTPAMIAEMAKSVNRER